MKSITTAPALLEQHLTSTYGHSSKTISRATVAKLEQWTGQGPAIFYIKKSVVHGTLLVQIFREGPKRNDDPIKTPAKDNPRLPTVGEAVAGGVVIQPNTTFDCLTNSTKFTHSTLTSAIEHTAGIL